MRRVGEVVAENSAGVTVWRIKRRPVWTGWRHNGAALVVLTDRHDARIKDGVCQLSHIAASRPR